MYGIVHRNGARSRPLLWSDRPHRGRGVGDLANANNQPGYSTFSVERDMLTFDGSLVNGFSHKT